MRLPVGAGNDKEVGPGRKKERRKEKEREGKRGQTGKGGRDGERRTKGFRGEIKRYFHPEGL
ncbi:MAG: hypothetical protein Q4B16_02315 [Bacteroidia bacterium]|nr:hypothetical protein [Bacteroidia bacterium]